MNSPYEGKFYISQGYYPGQHDGLDLVGVDSKDIHATQRGIVYFAGWENPANHSQGFGQYVCIKGIDGLFYYFGHLSQIKVLTGQSVKITDVIGVEGSTGYSTGSHCHYEVRKGFYKGTAVVDICSLSQIPNKEGGTYDDGYRPQPIKPATSFKIGDVVKIKTGAKYYNGIAIPQWVMNERWIISSVSGDRVVLGQNKSKSRDINSPINSNDIQLAECDINNPDNVKALASVLNSKGYACDTNGEKNDGFVNAMFKALCDIYAI